MIYWLSKFCAVGHNPKEMQARDTFYIGVLQTVKSAIVHCAKL